MAVGGKKRENERGAWIRSFLAPKLQASSIEPFARQIVEKTLYRSQFLPGYRVLPRLYLPFSEPDRTHPRPRHRIHSPLEIRHAPRTVAGNQPSIHPCKHLHLSRLLAPAIRSRSRSRSRSLFLESARIAHPVKGISHPSSVIIQHGLPSSQPCQWQAPTGRSWSWSAGTHQAPSKHLASPGPSTLRPEPEA